MEATYQPQSKLVWCVTFKIQETPWSIWCNKPYKREKDAFPSHSSEIQYLAKETSQKIKRFLVTNLQIRKWCSSPFRIGNLHKKLGEKQLQEWSSFGKEQGRDLYFQSDQKTLLSDQFSFRNVTAITYYRYYISFSLSLTRTDDTDYKFAIKRFIDCHLTHTHV